MGCVKRRGQPRPLLSRGVCDMCSNLLEVKWQATEAARLKEANVAIAQFSLYANCSLCHAIRFHQLAIVYFSNEAICSEKWPNG